jgi:hypothetical protein
MREVRRLGDWEIKRLRDWGRGMVFFSADLCFGYFFSFLFLIYKNVLNLMVENRKVHKACKGIMDVSLCVGERKSNVQRK